MTGYRHGTYAKALATMSTGQVARSPGSRQRRNHFVTVYYYDVPMRVRARHAEVGVLNIKAIRT